MVTVWGEYLTEEEETLTTDNLNLLLQVRFIPPKKPKVDKGVVQLALDWIKDNTLIVVMIGLAAGAAVIIWFLVTRKRRQEDALLDQYKSYIESQGQQREMGGVY
jgi:hypothetical protein